MENAKKIWKDYDSGIISEKEAVNLLLELLFTHKFEFGLAAFDDDTFSDFIVFMESRFGKILRKYKPELCDFRTYLHSVINLTAFWWKKKIQDFNIKNYCCQTMCLEENFNNMEYSTEEKDFYIEEPLGENLIPISRLAKEIMENLNIRAEKKKPITEKRAQEIIKVLALKSCSNITDNQIKIAAEITGMQEDDLHRMIRQADDTLNLKRNRISVMLNKRNFAYFQRKRKLIRETNLKNHYPDIYCGTNIKKTDIKWKKATEAISVAAPTLVPSKKTVAKILNMSTRKIKDILDDAKENFTDEAL